MASVKHELRNEGKGLHEWDYVPLCEERIVIEQIRGRSKLDPTYNMKLYESHPLMMQGAAPMSEPITVTYLDLDHLIETAGLTEAQKKTVHLLMRGWTETDIAEQAGCSRESIVMLFKRAVKKRTAGEG